MTLLSSLQQGQTVPNVVPVKRAGVAVSLVSMALSAICGYALNRGWLVDEVSAETVFALSSALVSAAMAFLSWVQVATTDKIGFAPPHDHP